MTRIKIVWCAATLLVMLLSPEVFGLEKFRIGSAFITGVNEVTVHASSSYNSDDFILLENGEPVEIEQVVYTEQEVFVITTTDDLDLKLRYQVKGRSEVKETQVHWKLIDEQFYFEGELGAIYSENSSEFRLWAPLATEVELHLYKDGESKIPDETITLEPGDKGVWSVTVQGDLWGRFYNYSVTNYGKTKLILDPYAKSMAVTTSDQTTFGKGAVVDPSLIGPELGFADIEGFEKREDAVIWEIHVRDFTVDPDISTSAQFGTYNAFTEKLDYIEQLGVTHVQLLPVLSYRWGNELANDIRMMDYEVGTNYNWGYDPHNYFSVEGMYSEDPTDPVLRIKELKELVQAVHAKGMGVTLDVVYNHTASLGLFEDIVPGYYHFMDVQGVPKTSYGGGRLGTTHAMVRKLVIESMVYWTEEFKVDGFRYDLMGDLDAKTVQMAFDEVKKINPDVIKVGEGWRTYAGDDGDGVTPADQDWMGDTESVAVFSDEIRNELKSGYGSEGQPRFLTGGPRNIRTIFNNIIGRPSNVNEDDPGDVLQYIAAHDNLTLHDVIAQSIQKDPAHHEKEIQQRIRLGNTIILTSQGVAFIHAGQEYGRTKQWMAEEAPEEDFAYVEGFEHPYFIENSYNASDAVNMFDWDKVEEEGIHKETMEFTRGLIALRKSTDAFRLGTEELVSKNVSLIDSPDIAETDLVIGYVAESTSGDEYYVFINADTEQRIIGLKVDLTNGQVLVDAENAGTEPIEQANGVQIHADEIILAPLTPVVIKAE